MLLSLGFCGVVDDGGTSLIWLDEVTSDGPPERSSLVLFFGESDFKWVVEAGTLLRHSLNLRGLLLPLLFFERKELILAATSSFEPLGLSVCLASLILELEDSWTYSNFACSSLFTDCFS